MSNPSKAKGSRWEKDVVQHVRDGGQKAERLVTAGALDEGDIALPVGDTTFVLEAKDERKWDLSGYVDEAVLEAQNYSKARGGVPVYPAAVVKRPRRGAGQAYVIMPLDSFLELTAELEVLYALRKALR